MNKKQFLTLVVAGLIVGGLGVYLYNKQKSSFTQGPAQSGERVVPNFPLNDIAQLRIKQSSSEVNIVRSNDTWTVRERYNYPANFTQVGEFLRKLWELKPIRDVEVGASQYGRLDLVNPAEAGKTNTGTLVEFKDKSGKTVPSLLLGKKYTKGSGGGDSPFGGGGDFPVGRYVLVQGGSPRVWLVSETFNDIEPKPEQWLDKDFFKVEKPKSVSVDDPKRTNSWSVTRESETGEWKLASAKEGEQTDSSKSSSFSYLLSSPSFNDVAAPDSKPEVTGLDKPLTAKIETFEGFTYSLNLGGNTNAENYYLTMKVDGNFASTRTPGKDEKKEDKDKLDKEFKDKLDKLQEKLKKEKRYEGWTYQVSKWTIDPLLKERKELIAEKKEEKKPEEAPEKKETAAPPVDILPPEIKNLSSPLPPVPQAPKPVTITPDTKPAEAKPAEQKPEEKKAEEKKPDDKKPEATSETKKPETKPAEEPKK